jgi:hypothetical protein
METLQLDRRICRRAGFQDADRTRTAEAPPTKTNPVAVFIHEVGTGRLTVKTTRLTLNGNFG